MNAPTTRALDRCEWAAEDNPFSYHEGKGGVMQTGEFAITA